MLFPSSFFKTLYDLPNLLLPIKVNILFLMSVSFFCIGICLLIAMTITAIAIAPGHFPAVHKKTTEFLQSFCLFPKHFLYFSRNTFPLFVGYVGSRRQV